MDVGVLHEGEQIGVRRHRLGANACGEDFHGVVIGVHRDSELAHIAAAIHAACALAGELHRGKQEGHEDADDGDHHQQLHERESGSFLGHVKFLKKYGWIRKLAPPQTRLRNRPK